MKTARRVLTTIFFIIFMAAGFVTVVFLPSDESSAEQENRNLASLPVPSLSTIRNGEFEEDFETYLSDNVGYRSVFTNISSVYKDNKGINSFGKIVEANGDLGTGTSTTSRLLVIDDRVMEIYDADAEAQEEYIDMVNFYAEKLPESINLYSMIIPTQIDFLSFYNTVGDSEREAIDTLYNGFDERVSNIDVYDTLKEHFDNGEYVYFRTDHHWTSLGAYYAYIKMGEDMGFEPLTIDNFEKHELEDFTGYLYNQAQSSNLANHKDTIEYYMNAINNIDFKCVTYSYIPGEEFDYTEKIFDLSKGTSYTMFMGGDQPYIEIDSQCGSDRTLLMIKDSYSNALLPWLTCSYGKIIVIDARTFDQSITKILETLPVDDFLITNYIMGTNFRDYIEMCKDIY